MQPLLGPVQSHRNLLSLSHNRLLVLKTIIPMGRSLSMINLNTGPHNTYPQSNSMLVLVPRSSLQRGTAWVGKIAHVTLHIKFQ